MPKSKIIINNDELVIRPSSVDSFLGCAYQWARVFLTGESSIPNGRAAIGTGVHRGAEVLWKDAMKTGNKEDIYIPGAVDAAVQEYKEETKNGVQHNDGEDDNTAISQVVEGVNVFVDDIMPFAEVPLAVEQRYTVPIDSHPLVKALSGTVDYLSDRCIADLKTSKRKATTSNYEIQQSIYKILVESNGIPVDFNLIQNVVFTKNPNGQILDMKTNEPKAKTVVNNLLDTLEVLATDKVAPEILFRGNPKYYLCSEKYCAFYNDCMFVKGEGPEEEKVEMPTL